MMGNFTGFPANLKIHNIGNFLVLLASVVSVVHDQRHLASNTTWRKERVRQVRIELSSRAVAKITPDTLRSCQLLLTDVNL